VRLSGSPKLSSAIRMDAQGKEEVAGQSLNVTSSYFSCVAPFVMVVFQMLLFDGLGGG
jgi:hypothetical protein